MPIESTPRPAVPSRDASLPAAARPYQERTNSHWDLRRGPGLSGRHCPVLLHRLTVNHVFALRSRGKARSVEREVRSVETRFEQDRSSVAAPAPPT